jgi:hypothetical protein
MMGKAVAHTPGGIAAGEHDKSPFQFVMASAVEQVTDAHHASSPAAEEERLRGGSTFAESFAHGILFCSAPAQIVVSNAEVQSFEADMDGKESLVGSVPEVMTGRCIGQILGTGRGADCEHYKEKFPLASHANRLGTPVPDNEIT